MTGFRALIIIGLILFIAIPALLLSLKTGSVFVFPISVLGGFIILIAFLKNV